MLEIRICPICNGQGRLPSANNADTGTAGRVCHGCNGKGWIAIWVPDDYNHPPLQYQYQFPRYGGTEYVIPDTTGNTGVTYYTYWEIEKLAF